MPCIYINLSVVFLTELTPLFILPKTEIYLLSQIAKVRQKTDYICRSFVSNACASSLKREHNEQLVSHKDVSSVSLSPRSINK